MVSGTFSWHEAELYFVNFDLGSYYHFQNKFSDFHDFIMEFTTTKVHALTIVSVIGGAGPST